jgi:nitrite reductase (NO-forming)
MPKLPLTDQEIANVLTYVFNSMGNSGKEVTPDEVGVVRAQNPAPGMARKAQNARISEATNPFE